MQLERALAAQLVLIQVLVFEDATGGRHRDILVAPETSGRLTGFTP